MNVKYAGTSNIQSGLYIITDTILFSHKYYHDNINMLNLIHIPPPSPLYVVFVMSSSLSD